MCTNDSARALGRWHRRIRQKRSYAQEQILLCHTGGKEIPILYSNPCRRQNGQECNTGNHRSSRKASIGTGKKR